MDQLVQRATDGATNVEHTTAIFLPRSLGWSDAIDQSLVPQEVPGLIKLVV